jgi:hypothetical protein
VLWAWQLVLWVVEENVEIHLTGAPTPGLSVLWGAHVLAPLVHLAVAAALAIGIWILLRPVTELTRALRAIVDARTPSRARPPAAAPVRSTRTWTPSERWGRHLWSRPPPAGTATA